MPSLYESYGLDGPCGPAERTELAGLAGLNGLAVRGTVTCHIQSIYLLFLFGGLLNVLSMIGIDSGL